MFEPLVGAMVGAFGYVIVWAMFYLLSK